MSGPLCDIVMVEAMLLGANYLWRDGDTAAGRYPTIIRRAALLRFDAKILLMVVQHYFAS